MSIPKKIAHITSVFLKNITEALPQYIFWKDSNSVYLGCNKNFSQLVGLSSPEEIVGKTDNDINWQSTGHTANTFQKGDRAAMSGHPIVNQEEVLALPNGKTLFTLVSKLPIIDEGRAIGVVGYFTDITQRKKMEDQLKIAKEKAEEADKAKSVFISNMSHDVRTPLTGMIGISEILEKEGDSTKDREYGHIIHNSSEKLLELLNDILEIVSAEEIIGGENVKNEELNLVERIEQVIGIFTPNAELKHINLSLALDKDTPTYVISDRIKVDRILLNLVSNAIKFTHEGEVQLKVKVLSKIDKEASVEFKIVDTGSGIPDDKIKHIFDRFYKVVPSYEAKHEGFGIGLFIVKKYIELLKGKIDVVSKLGEGTTFTVVLPLQISGKIPDQNTMVKKEKFTVSKLAEEERDQLSKDKKIDTVKAKTVLIIEDDALASKLAKMALETEGFKAEAVDNAEAGLKLVMEKPYDLIVTDIGLPKMDGNQFTQLERTWERITNHEPLPIVGLSAHSNKLEAEKAGMDLLLTKPLNKKKIEEIKLKFFSGVFEEKNVEESTKEDGSNLLGLDLPGTEAEMFQLDNYPLFDKDEALQNCSGDINVLKEILSMLVNETIPEELDNLEKAHSNLDWEQIRKLGHKLKGGALYCGAIKMQYACQYMERYILAGHSKRCEDLYLQLKQVLNCTLQEVTNYLSSER